MSLLQTVTHQSYLLTYLSRHHLIQVLQDFQILLVNQTRSSTLCFYATDLLNWITIPFYPIAASLQITLLSSLMNSSLLPNSPYPQTASIKPISSKMLSRTSASWTHPILKTSTILNQLSINLE